MNIFVFALKSTVKTKISIIAQQERQRTVLAGVSVGILFSPSAYDR
ncbi:hypothetical protein [Nostoc sp.]